MVILVIGHRFWYPDESIILACLHKIDVRPDDLVVSSRMQVLASVLLV